MKAQSKHIHHTYNPCSVPDLVSRSIDIYGRSSPDYLRSQAVSLQCHPRGGRPLPSSNLRAGPPFWCTHPLTIHCQRLYLSLSTSGDISIAVGKGCFGEWGGGVYNVNLPYLINRGDGGGGGGGGVLPYLVKINDKDSFLPPPKCPLPAYGYDMGWPLILGAWYKPRDVSSKKVHRCKLHIHLMYVCTSTQNTTYACNTHVIFAINQ